MDTQLATTATNMDACRDWIKVRGVGEDGVVLVRPDHFVAWRSRCMSTDPQATLKAVLENILGFKVQHGDR